MFFFFSSFLFSVLLLLLSLLLDHPFIARPLTPQLPTGYAHFIVCVSIFDPSYFYFFFGLATFSRLTWLLGDVYVCVLLKCVISLMTWLYDIINFNIGDQCINVMKKIFYNNKFWLVKINNNIMWCMVGACSYLEILVPCICYSNIHMHSACSMHLKYALV